MKDLFSEDLFAEPTQTARSYEPLAVRMRPRKLQEYIGQEEILAPGKFLRRMMDTDNLPSLILFGPPGTGKTTLANIIAQTTGATFEKLNAVAAGIADIRKCVDAARDRLPSRRQRTILFIDEIHRFNKGQQDALLPYVENGTVILVGATTENPYFEVNAPLLSRMRVVRLQPLSEDSIRRILRQALEDKERGLGKQHLGYKDEILTLIAGIAGGDARVALNILEQAATVLEASRQPAAAEGEPGQELTEALIRTVAGEKLQIYDKAGDNHYDTVSAFIKSMRGSDPDAALHYLARMLEAGEDVKFIARRIVICASEDVGNADPQALVVAMAAAQAVQFIGLPEGRIPLAQAVTYIACAPKSNAAYMGINQAAADVKNRDCGQVPLHLRDSSYRGARQFEHGKNYRYPHDAADGFIEQQYLPDTLKGKRYYQPTDRGAEAAMQERLRWLWKNR
ncbi:MAG TPA: replication-associated recombination protein A [Patescibacteria group bacterium]|nr:replication-associated recombination protein A [Patescibacteria group bacterium]